MYNLIHVLQYTELYINLFCYPVAEIHNLVSSFLACCCLDKTETCPARNFGRHCALCIYRDNSQVALTFSFFSRTARVSTVCAERKEIYYSFKSLMINRHGSAHQFCEMHKSTSSREQKERELLGSFFFLGGNKTNGDGKE